MNREKLISYRIVEAVHKSGLTPKKFEEKTEVKNGNVLGQYTSGRNMPGSLNLSYLCQAAGVSADWILGLTDDPGEQALQNQMKDTCRLAVQKFGSESQTRMLFEEMAELQNAICKHYRGRDSAEHIAEEIADVEIMLEQMKELYHFHNLVDQCRGKKVERLRERLEDTQNGSGA